MNRQDWADIAGLVFLLAIVYTLVRPASQGPYFVQTVGQALTGLVTAAVSG